MKLLALETATDACSAALWIDGAVFSRHQVVRLRRASMRA
jgi:tRNA threonylcarbamoyladenosine biosynthesis protein TsaB